MKTYLAIYLFLIMAERFLDHLLLGSTEHFTMNQRTEELSVTKLSQYIKKVFVSYRD